MLIQIKQKIEDKKASEKNLEELKLIIEELNKEGLDALKNNKLADSLKKYKEIKELIVKNIE